MQTLKLTRSEVNTLIAGLMLCAVRYDGMNGFGAEAKKYRDLEHKLRNACYDNDNIATVTINAAFQ